MPDNTSYRDIAKKTVDGIMGRALKGLGDNPVIYLDSGAIIQFEKTINTLRKASANHFGSYEFYNFISEVCPKSFVTTYVLAEVEKHCKCHCINGHPEISRETTDSIRAMHKSLCTFIREAEHQKEYDAVREDVFWASLLSFSQNHKKCNGDRISVTDKDLIAAAVDTRYTEETTGVAVLTTDAHVVKTIDVLTGNHCCAVDNYHSIMDPLASRVIGDTLPAFPFMESRLFDYAGIKGVDLMDTRK